MNFEMILEGFNGGFFGDSQGILKGFTILFNRVYQIVNRIYNNFNIIYDILNRMNRNKLSDKGVDIKMEDYSVTPAKEGCIDLFYLAEK